MAGDVTGEGQARRKLLGELDKASKGGNESTDSDSDDVEEETLLKAAEGMKTQDSFGGAEQQAAQAELERSKKQHEVAHQPLVACGVGNNGAGGVSGGPCEPKLPLSSNSQQLAPCAVAVSSEAPPNMQPPPMGPGIFTAEMQKQAGVWRELAEK